MWRVSSESSRSRMRVSPSASAASSRMRLEMLFDPGIFTVPVARRMGARSRWSKAVNRKFKQERRRDPASLLTAQPFVARYARPGEYFFQSCRIALLQQLLHLGQLALIGSQFLQQGLAVGDTDLA